MRRLGVLIWISIVGLSSCGGTEVTPATQLSIVRFVGHDATLFVQVANTDAERARGLMSVTRLAADRGMVFVWREPVEATFWMKDTPIPLSIAFWDARGRIVAIHEMTPCRADPCRTYGALAPFVAAVEANAEWFADHGVRVGDRAVLEGGNGSELTASSATQSR